MEWSMAKDVAPLILAGVRARMIRDFKRLEHICSRLRSLAGKESISNWGQAHLEILAGASLSFESDLKRKESILKAAASKLSPHERSESFIFLYESAGLLIHDRNHTAALQYSLLAEEKSFDRNSWLSAHLNSLTCYAALGVEISDRLDGLHIELTRSGDEAHPRLKEYFHEMRLRTWFRQGDVNRLREYEGPDCLYLKWLQGLPQLRWKKSFKFQALDLESIRRPYNRFSVNTLLYRVDAADMIHPAMNHWCDRLYLWTWRMIKDPREVPASHIYWLLENFSFENFIERMTLEDRLMVSHSLALLSIFDPVAEKSLKALYQRLQSLNYSFHPFLAAERSEIDRMRTSGLRPESRRHARASKRTSRIRICTRHGRVEGPQGSLRIHSADMAEAFALFLEQKSTSAVSLTDFVQAIFKFPHYDPFTHYRRVYNLLSRLKKCAEGAFEFSLRDGTIHFKIRPNSFELVESKNLPGGDRERWRKIVSRMGGRLPARPDSAGVVARRPIDLAPAFLLHEYRSREQIQDFTGWNKSMAVRKLKQFMAAGAIVKHGTGRASVYSLPK